MKNYKIKHSRTFSWETEVKAKSKEDAINIAKKIDDGYWGVCDGITYDTGSDKYTAEIVAKK